MKNVQYTLHRLGH